MSKFMQNIKKGFINTLNLSEGSAKLYLDNLRRLNANKDFNNIKFLNNIDKIKDFLEQYTNNSRNTYYNAIINILKLKGMTKTDLFKNYSKLSRQSKKQINQEYDEGEKIKEKNKISWEDVIKKRNQLNETVKILYDNYNIYNIPKKDYRDILNHLILSLYTYIPPRRNIDYINMFVIKDYNEDMDDDKNYLDMKNKTFYFNVYKTADKYGEQSLKINDDLFDIIENYLNFHNIKNKDYKKNNPVPFLRHKDGDKLNHSNQITRALNDIFDNNISTSIIRSLYISKNQDVFNKLINEYKNLVDGANLEQLAKDMGHSHNTQKKYFINNA